MNWEKLKYLLWMENWHLPRLKRTRQALSSVTQKLRSMKSSKWGGRGTKVFVTLAILLAIIYLMKTLWVIVKNWVVGGISEQFPEITSAYSYLGYAWYAFWSILFIALPIWGFVFVIRRYRKTHPNAQTASANSQVTRNDSRGYWIGIPSFSWKNNLVMATVGWIALWFIPFMIWPSWWIARWQENILFIVGGIIIATIGVWLKPPSRPIRYKLGYLATSLGAFVIIFFLFFGYEYGQRAAEEWRQSVKSWWWSEKTNTTARSNQPVAFPITISSDNQVAIEVMRFWRISLQGYEAELAITIAYLESGFRQFDENGNVLVSATSDRGVMQIHEPKWGELSRQLGYNIDTLDGNLQMALHIWRLDGPKAWMTLDKARALLEGQPVQNPVIVVNANRGNSEAQTTRTDNQVTTQPSMTDRHETRPSITAPIFQRQNCKNGVLSAKYENLDDKTWSDWVEIPGEMIQVNPSGYFYLEDGEGNESSNPSSIGQYGITVKGGRFRIRVDWDMPRPSGKPVLVRWTSC